MSKKKKWIIGILLILIAIGGFIWFIKSRAPKTTYTTADVLRGNLSQTVSETGTIKTVNQTDLSFKVSGRVVNLLADVGDRVKKGQLLARLDIGTLGSELIQAQQNVKFQKETLDSMKRKKSLYNGDDRDAQQHRIIESMANVQTVQTQIRDTYMYSPIDGMILKRNVEPFETTVANSPTPVFTIGDPDDLVIETEVPESDITKIQIGQKAQMTFDALPAEESFEATIVQIDPSSTVIQDVVDYRIKLKLTKNDFRIKPGMTANIDIKTAEKNDVIMVPMRAVKVGSDNKKTVDVLEAENVVKTVFVQTGLQGDDGMIEITNGLNGSEKVITFVTTK